MNTDIDLNETAVMVADAPRAASSSGRRPEKSSLGRRKKSASATRSARTFPRRQKRKADRTLDTSLTGDVLYRRDHERKAQHGEPAEAVPWTDLPETEREQYMAAATAAQQRKLKLQKVCLTILRF